MGGPGSGSWCRWSTKTTCEEVKRIDIRIMKKNGLLEPGWRRSMSWHRGDEPTGNINYRVYENAIILSYRSRAYGDDEWKDIEETVRFDRTPCNYGGERLWFRCPHCGRRVAVLYGLSSRFLCRHCYRLPYGSQQENFSYRMQRKARKIRDKVGASHNLFEPIWKKPKGMHWKTYEKLVRQDEEANQASVYAMAEKLGMFKELEWM